MTLTSLCLDKVHRKLAAFETRSKGMKNEHRILFALVSL